MRSLFIFILFFSTAAFAKRVAPEVINPVIHKGFEYTFEVVYIDCKDKAHQCAMQVFMVGKDIGAEKVIWKRDLYQIKFNRSIETDVQTVFPRSLVLDNGILKAVDDRGTEYQVEAKTGKLRKPLKSVIYNNI